MEAVSGFAAQSARCKVRRVGLVLIFLEDFGGHVRDGPASPWSSREFQGLEGACDVRRGSAFLCQLASTDQRRPVGILTNLPRLQSRLYLQWPSLERHSNLSTKAYFQNRVRVFHRMLRSGERTLRSTSSPPLPSRRAQSSGQFVWPTSIRSAFPPFGMGVLSSPSTLAAVFPFLRLRTPEQRFILTGWLVLCRGRPSAISALDRLKTSSLDCLLRNRGGRFSRRLLV